MKSAAKPPATFEAALKELETLVESLESGTTPLEESLKAYERGTTLVRYCQDTLGQAEQKLRVLDGDTVRDLDGAETEGNDR